MKTDDIGYPPADLQENEFIVSVVKSRGSTFDVQVPESSMGRLRQVLPNSRSELLVALSPRLKNKFFVRRGGLAVVEVRTEDEGRVCGIIVNLVADKRAWQKQPYWPAEFAEKGQTYEMDLPPSDSDDYEHSEAEEEP